MILDIVIGMRCDFSELLIFLGENREYLRDGGGGGEAFFMRGYNFFSSGWQIFESLRLFQGRLKYMRLRRRIFLGGGGMMFEKC